MATNEGTRGVGSSIGTFLNIVIALLAIVVLLGIGYAQWPAFKAAYYAPVPIQQPERATPARNEQPVNPTPIIIIQSVPADAAAQRVILPIAPMLEPGISATPALPSAPQLIVIHEGGGAPRITGSGACKVATGARRCGK